MRPSINPTCSQSAMWKLGLLILLVLLPLLLLACASSKQLAQSLEENQGNFLTPLPAKPASRPAAKLDDKALPVKTDKPASKHGPLQVCAVVPDDDLQDMRGCQGEYLFNYNFDVNMTNMPQVSISSNFMARLPDGSPAPNVNMTSASFQDNNVSYTAGIMGGSGIGSSLMVTGQNLTVLSFATFTFQLPDTSILIPSISVMPAASLSGIGR